MQHGPIVPFEKTCVHTVIMMTTCIRRADVAQVETTVSNSILRITGSWIGSSIGFGVMSSAIATNPYGALRLLPPVGFSFHQQPVTQAVSQAASPICRW